MKNKRREHFTDKVFIKYNPFKWTKIVCFLGYVHMVNAKSPSANQKTETLWIYVSHSTMIR